MLPTKFRFIWPSGFRGKDFIEIDQSETGIAYGGHVVKKHVRHRQLLFLIGWFLKIFSYETLGQMNRYLVGSIYGRSSIKTVYFGSIR
jgi:hypothetical protein